LALLATIANFLSAFAGGGAGLIQLPALILFGLPFPVALATHKIASVALGLGAGLRHFRHRTLATKLTVLILSCGIPGVCLGSNIVLIIPDNLATISLGILTLWLGIYSSSSKSLGITNLDKRLNQKEYILGGLVLFLIGVINGSLSSGTGLFVTIWLVRWFGITYTKAIGYTLILVGLFWNGTGALVLGLRSEVKWDWLPVLVIGSLFGGYLGAHFSLETGNHLVKKSFEMISLLMGSSLIIQGII
tara:strand:- start:91 stop:831 length:741 start_codon:yes stop_codon:yes gene_type:complete